MTLAKKNPKSTEIRNRVITPIFTFLNLQRPRVSSVKSIYLAKRIYTSSKA